MPVQGCLKTCKPLPLKELWWTVIKCWLSCSLLPYPLRPLILIVTFFCFVFYCRTIILYFILHYFVPVLLFPLFSSCLLCSSHQLVSIVTDDVYFSWLSTCVFIPLVPIVHLVLPLFEKSCYVFFAILNSLLFKSPYSARGPATSPWPGWSPSGGLCWGFP